jgi:hypothetical protein
MSNKYPSKNTPYRYRRRKPHGACVDRLGMAKAIFKSAEEAREHMHANQEPYECPTGHGWHIRTRRDGDRLAL